MPGPGTRWLRDSDDARGRSVGAEIATRSRLANAMLDRDVARERAVDAVAIPDVRDSQT